MTEPAKPDGWYWPITPITPPRLAGGERNPVIWSGIISAGLGLQVAPRVHGSVGAVPASIVVAGIAIAIWLAAVAVLYRCWLVDPWLLSGGTLFRFLRWPKVIPSHSSWAASGLLRSAARKRRWIR